MKFPLPFKVPAFALPMLLISCSISKWESLQKSGSASVSNENGWTEIARIKDGEDPKAEKMLDQVLGDDLPEIRAEFSLGQCVDQALELNRKRPASLAAIAVAEAQHQQALAGWWPQLTLQGTANLRSDDPNFVFPAQDFVLPETNVAVPAQQFVYPASTITTPASAMNLPLGPRGAFVPIPIPSQQISVPAQSIHVPAQNFSVPSQTFHLEEQDVKVMDRWTYGAKLNMEWLLWNAGWRKALNQQAKAGVAAAKEDARRTDLEIVYDVTRMYEGAVLAAKLEGIARDTLERMEATLNLTESLYQGGSMQVKKTDYLRNKVLVEGLKSMVNRLEENRTLARSALANSMGLSWRSEILPEASGITFKPVEGSMEQLVADTFEFSPDWRQLEIGLSAAEAKIREEKAGHMPRIALLGNIHAIETPYEGGYATDENLKAWNIGIGVELPLFDGFLTRAKVSEAKARLAELKEQKVLLREGLALQVKAHLIQLESMRKQENNNRSASTTATENRKLTEKAYRNDLIEADKVFTSQLMEAITEARQIKLRFDHSITKSRLDFLVGRDVLNRLGLVTAPGNA